MHSLGIARLLRNAGRPRGAHLHGLAAAGAMLTCVAAVLNVGPFAKAPKFIASPSNVDQKVDRAIPQQPVVSASVHEPEFKARTQPDYRKVAKDSSIELASISVAEVAVSSLPVGLKGEDAELQVKPPQDAPQAIDPATQPHDDRPNPELMKRATAVGVWAPNGATCSAGNFREGILPAVINNDGAWAGETACVFTNRKQTEKGWKVVAKCSDQRERWTANVTLTVNGNRLTWASKRGTQVYTRCATDVLMADAR